MEKYIIEKDIRVFCIRAASFPDGIQAAYDRLHAMVPQSGQREYYSISYPQNGEIVYKAAIKETYPGEAEKYGCEPFTIMKGQYISVLIRDYIKDLPGVGRVFGELTKHPDIEPNGVCVDGM